MRSDRTSGEEPAPPPPEVLQAAVLGLLLAYHPAHFSVSEVVRELGEEPTPVQEALRDLAGAGLVHRHGPFAFATRAAVRGHELRL